MKSVQISYLVGALLMTLAGSARAQSDGAADPLPSWNDGDTKQAIRSFVEEVTTEGSPKYVPPAERIATFDNDGCLWCEQPMYTQLAFALDRVKALAPKHDFMRPVTTEAYGIPREQIIGSTIKTSFEMRDGKPVIMRLAELDFIDDKAGKAVNIEKIIGKRPIFVAGNSDGDYEMLQYATIDNPRPSLGLVVHHTDAEREYAYDRDSKFGRLDKALAEAPERGWIVVDMKDDWNQVFSGE